MKEASLPLTEPGGKHAAAKFSGTEPTRLFNEPAGTSGSNAICLYFTAMTEMNDAHTAAQSAGSQEAAAPRANSAADYTALDPEARAVLDFWFGAPDSPGFGQASKRWVARDDTFDTMLRER